MTDTHSHHAPSSRRALLLALFLTLLFAVVEVLAGWYSGSLALLGDAGHMLTDGLSLGIAAFTSWLALRAPSRRHSYGLGRAELLAALFNALFMIVVVVAISTAAVDRLLNPHPVEGETVTVVALIGLLINLFVAWLLSRSDKNINVRAALLHVIGDLLGSVAALISGVVITVTGWNPIDPILSLVIVVLILISSLRLLRDGLHLLLDGVPFTTDLAAVGHALAGIKGVREVHDLHIWPLSAERTALSAHLVVDDFSSWMRQLTSARVMLHHEFDIDHITLQPELRPLSDALLQIKEPRND
jgi:cobalt-zinc-cadmium efflux system protein